jgi:hypothetical protein
MAIAAMPMRHGVVLRDSRLLNKSWVAMAEFPPVFTTISAEKFARNVVMRWLTHPSVPILLFVLVTSCSVVPPAMLSTQPSPPIATDNIRATTPASPLITASPSPAPLLQDAIASCKVVRPNTPSPFSDFSNGLVYGNDDGTLFTIPMSDGKVTFRPGGSGSIEPDGSLAIKWPWYRNNIKGQVVVEGHRLDAPAPTLRAVMGCCRDRDTAFPGCCYGNTGFVASVLYFPTEGCWEVIGRLGSHSLTFVTLVIKENQ